MPLRSFRTVSFVGIKKTPTDPCILCSVRTIDETPTPPPLPRTRSDLSNRKITLIGTDSSDSDSCVSQLTPPPVYMDDEESAPPEEINSEPLIFITPLNDDSEDQNSPFTSDDNLDDGLSSTPPKEATKHSVLRRPKRNKPQGAQKRMNRRGLVWTGDENKKGGSDFISGPINKKNGPDFISDPILISHPSLRIGYQTEPRLHPRSTEEQQELLRKLAESQVSSTPPKMSGDTNNNEPRSKTVRRAFTLERLKDSSSKPRPPLGGSKMASRIQRTIRALYDNRRSFERLEEEGRSSEDELTDQESLESSLGSDRCVILYKITDRPGYNPPLFLK